MCAADCDVLDDMPTDMTKLSNVSAPVGMNTTKMNANISKAGIANFLATDMAR